MADVTNDELLNGKWQEQVLLFSRVTDAIYNASLQNARLCALCLQPIYQTE